MAIFSKNGKWYIDFYNNGRRIRKCIGFRKSQARKAPETRKGEIVQERYGVTQKKKRIRLEDFSRAYLEYYRRS